MFTTRVPVVAPSAIVMLPRSVTTVVTPCEALLNVAVKVTLASSSVTLLVLRLTVVVVLGLYLGIFTPTESAAVGSALTLAMGMARGDLRQIA